jgi:topoisomerase-4 subunit A
VFNIEDLPELARGKGNKIINIPKKAYDSGEEKLMLVEVFTQQDVLVFEAGQRHLNLKYGDLGHYIGERGRRGRKLPRGFQRVERIIKESGVS